MIKCGGLKYSIVCYLEYKKSTNYILFIPSSFIIHAKDIHLESHQYFHASVLEKKGKTKSCRNWSSKINAEFANFMSMHILQILKDMCCFHCIWFWFFAKKSCRKRSSKNQGQSEPALMITTP
jgi:hypothetical protein